jgi:hypothetical protein
MIDEDKLNSNFKKQRNFSHYVDRLFEDLIPTLELMFGRRLTKDEKKEIEKVLEPLKSPSQDFAQKVESLKNGYDESNLLGISEDFIRKSIPDSCQGESPLEYVRGRLFEPTQPTVEFIKKSKYVQYVDCIRQIIDSGMGKGTGQVIAYISAVNGTEADLQTWGQAIASSMGKIVKYLTPDRKRFSERLALRCIDEYGKMSGVYERLVAIIAGFVSIGPKRIPNYSSYRRKSLAKNMRRIENKGWSTITNEFASLIRNSIAHQSYVRVPAERIVRFSDPRSGQEESVSYKLLFEKTRELVCLVLALSQFMGLVDDALLRNFISSTLSLPKST